MARDAKFLYDAYCELYGYADMEQVCQHCGSGEIEFENADSGGFPRYIDYIGECKDCGEDSEIVFVQALFNKSHDPEIEKQRLKWDKEWREKINKGEK